MKKAMVAASAAEGCHFRHAAFPQFVQVEPQKGGISSEKYILFMDFVTNLFLKN